MANNNPWEAYPEIWATKSAFFTYLRGGFRSIWSRYPAKLLFKKQQMVKPPPSYKGRAKSLGECHYCKKQFPASALEVDHVAQVGSCNSWEEAYIFLYKLLECVDNWVLACKPCHKIKSLSERNSTTFEEAAKDKEVIAIMKKPKQEIIDFCASFGYNASSLSNAKKRREAVENIIKKENT